jgi:hypothetical protein
MYATSAHVDSVRDDVCVLSSLAGRPPAFPAAGGSFTYASKRMDPTTFTLGL